MSKLWDDLKKNMKDWGSVAVEKAEEVSKIAVAKTEEITKIGKHKIDIHQLQKERAKIFGQYDHVRVYGYDYFEKLRSIGFNVNEVNFTSEFTDLENIKYCLSKGEILPVCYK